MGEVNKLLQGPTWPGSAQAPLLPITCSVPAIPSQHTDIILHVLNSTERVKFGEIKFSPLPRGSNNHTMDNSCIQKSMRSRGNFSFNSLYSFQQWLTKITCSVNISFLSMSPNDEAMASGDGRQYNTYHNNRAPREQGQIHILLIQWWRIIPTFHQHVQKAICKSQNM